MTEHRFTRLLLWARLLFAWLAAALSGAEGGAFTGRRRLHRYRFASALALTHVVRNVVIVRASQITGQCRGARKAGGPPTHMVRRAARQPMRAVAGLDLNRRLRAARRGGMSAVCALLSDIDALATRLARRLRARLTRICRTLLAIAPADAVSSLAMVAPCAADSS